VNQFGLSRVIANQVMYNLFSREAEDELIPYCEENGTGIIAFSALARGVLTGKYTKNQPFPENSRGGNLETKQFASRFLKDNYLDKIEKLNLI
ncbi:aldo/keto reductase, partial [Escherichia coli]|nr:aldo/keto reductase [Escherichia coli]